MNRCLSCHTFLYVMNGTMAREVGADWAIPFTIPHPVPGSVPRGHPPCEESSTPGWAEALGVRVCLPRDILDAEDSTVATKRAFASKPNTQGVPQ